MQDKMTLEHRALIVAHDAEHVQCDDDAMTYPPLTKREQAIVQEWAKDLAGQVTPQFRHALAKQISDHRRLAPTWACFCGGDWSPAHVADETIKALPEYLREVGA